MGAKPILLVVLATLLTACMPGTGAPAPIPAPTSPSRIDTFRVSISTLGGRARTVRVYLPPGYDGGSHRFPVLYLQDGQNLFVPGLFGDWQVDETIDRMVREGRSRGLIVVGVDNSANRWDEYGPWVNADMYRWVEPSWSAARHGGEGDAYVAFLADSLKPQIDRRYRTRTGREDTGIGGSSMGGLISLHAGLTRPDVFSRVLSMSTAVWFAEDDGPWLAHNRLLGAIRRGPVPRDVRFYLDIGTEERSRERDPDVRDADGGALTYPRAYREGSEAVAAALLAAGAPPANVMHLVDQGAPHHESAWARRMDAALTWLFR
jgi:predicted alpha/beta superfamily hydrolase